MPNEPQAPLHVPQQFMVIFIHRDGDDVQETGWPSHFPLPRWGESFIWNGDEYEVIDSGWVLNEIDFPDTPEGAKAAQITYHIHLGHEDDDHT